MKINNLISIALVSIVSILLLAVTLFTMSVYAQEDGNTTDSDMPKFFAIQHAESGSIVQINETDYTLGLNDISDKTILFSDRPDRIVTSVSTSDFIGNWSTGGDSFAKNAPNAVLVIDGQEQQDVAVVELFSPIYDSDKKTLKYDIIPDNRTSIELSSDFEQLTLIVDEAGRDHIIIRDENG